MTDMLTFLTVLMVSHMSQAYKIVNIFTYIYITLYICMHHTYLHYIHTLYIINILNTFTYIFRYICIYLNIYSLFYGV